MIGSRAEPRVVGPGMAHGREAFSTRPGARAKGRSGDNEDPRWLDRAMHCSHACGCAAVRTNTMSIRQQVSGRS
jgi:hypothetical protein